MSDTTKALVGKHIIITGGGGALGRDVVGQLLGAGAACFIPARTAADCVGAPWESNPSVHMTADVDLADERAVEAYYASVSAHSELWASIHIAGGFAMSPAVETSSDSFVRMMQMNALTCMNCSKHAAIAMKKTGTGGRIVNVGARPGVMPELGAGMVAYTASKAAVCAITQSLGAELAPDNILVNAVIPSIMDTPANRSAMPDADHSAWPTTADVARTMVFLASPDNMVTRSALVPVYGRS